MNITVIGRGHVGGGLARRWQKAGHIVKALGHEGGDASDADVVVVAVPSGDISEALHKVTGLRGQVTIDTTNAYRGRNEAFPSLAHEVKSIVGGPTAKAFNANSAAIYDQIDKQRARPTNLVVAEPEAREIAELLSRDAGYDPLYIGGLENARMLEDFLFGVYGAVGKSFGGWFFFRFARPGDL